jgi:hypothetical protein
MNIDCMVDTDRFRVQILPADGYSGQIDDRAAVRWKIGGKDGWFDNASNRAAVQVQNGMLVEFRLRGSRSNKPTAQLETFSTPSSGRRGWSPHR